VELNDLAPLLKAFFLIGPMLTGGHPNPFIPQKTITFALDRPQHAKVAVHDLTGRLLGVLANRKFDAGHHSVVWVDEDATSRAVPFGTYIVSLSTETDVPVKKCC
jgi:hypothetical protein